MPKPISNQRGTRPLPPAGDERQEELSRRTDELEEQAAGLEVEAIDPDTMRVEPELAQHFDELSVANRDPAYAYCWVNSGFFGRFVKEKLAQGWEVVQGDMPEAPELKGMGADTTRRLGDVILLRITKDRFLLLQRRDRELRRQRHEAVEAPLRELGEKYASRGVTVLTGDAALNRMGAGQRQPVRMTDTPDRMLARQMATREVDKLVREGRVPGAPAPGERRE